MILHPRIQVEAEIRPNPPQIQSKTYYNQSKSNQSQAKARQNQTKSNQPTRNPKQAKTKPSPRSHRRLRSQPPAPEAPSPVKARKPGDSAACHSPYGPLGSGTHCGPGRETPGHRSYLYTVTSLGSMKNS